MPETIDKKKQTAIKRACKATVMPLDQIPEGPLSLDFFRKLPQGTIIRLYYWTINRGSFYWKHNKVCESTERVDGEFFYPTEMDEWSGLDDTLYVFGDSVCRGSGAEPVHGHKPTESDR
jgi:hypothetical protein